MGSRVPDPRAVPTEAARRRSIEATRAAARFYRRELFRDKSGWSRKYLESGAAFEVLAPDTRWLIGYAPTGRSRLVDHLKSQGFDLATVRHVGLGVVGADGRLVDRFRDQLMLPARNDRLELTGFIGLRHNEGNPYYTMSPDTQIHRRAGALVGIVEQLDLLSGEATPVLVNDPLDALAVERISRFNGGRWIGIPLCGALLSAEQARILAAHAATDTVVVLVTGSRQGKRAAVECLSELTAMFRRVQSVQLPPGQSPARLWMAAGGHQRLHEELLLTRPLADYLPKRSTRRRPAGLPEPPDADTGPLHEL